MESTERLPLRRRLKKFGVWLSTVTLPALYIAYMRFVELTSSVDDSEVQGLLDSAANGTNITVALLHQNVATIPFFFRNRGIYALANVGDAGDLISATLERCGFKMFRGGSSNRDSRRTPIVREMIRVAGAEGETGSITAVTPDGSQGPAGVVKPGIALLAMKTRSDIYAVGVSATRAIYAKTWDRTMFPLPFGKIVVHASGPTKISPRAKRAEFDAARREVEEALHDIHAQSFHEAGRKPVPMLNRLEDAA